MLYYLLGALLSIAIRLIIYLKSIDKNIKINPLHEILALMLSMYMVFILGSLYNNVPVHTHKQMMVIGLFIPFGYFVPVLYRRFRFLLMNIILGAAFSGLICVLQLIYCKKTEPIIVLFAVFGIMIGFILHAILASIFKGLRGKAYIKQKKKKAFVIKYEVEIMFIFVTALFFAVAGVDDMIGKKLEPKIKGTATYEPQNKYENIYYADKDKYQRYDRYAKLNPNMSLEDVVWRVDANLDEKFYDDAYTTKISEDEKDPLLINKFNKLADDFEPKKLVTIEGDYVATPETVKAYKELTSDMKKEGLTVYVVSSYRSYSYQKNLYNYYMKKDKSKDVVDTYSSRPGYSEHHTGRALDISQVKNNLDAFEGSDEANWVYDNAYKYGFIVRYKKGEEDVTGYIFEPWHISYVGKEIAQTMHDENIQSLEEYVVKYVDHEKK